MRELLNAFLFTLSYFTTIAVFAKKMQIDNKTYKYALLLLPLIGAILAICVLGINFALNIFFHPLYAAFFASIAYLALYGFIHTEAIIDVVDAWFASYSNKDAYAVMKESTIGAIGALYACCFVLLKVGITTYVLYEKEYGLFIVVCIFSRLNLIYLLQYFSFSKDSFISLAFKDSGVSKLKIVALLYILVTFLLTHNVLILLIISLLCFYFTLRVLNHKFGFTNGDCLGFSLEHTELVLLNIGLLLLL